MVVHDSLLDQRDGVGEPSPVPLQLDHECAEVHGRIRLSGLERERARVAGALHRVLDLAFDQIEERGPLRGEPSQRRLAQLVGDRASLARARASPLDVGELQQDVCSAIERHEPPHRVMPGPSELHHLCGPPVALREGVRDVQAAAEALQDIDEEVAISERPRELPGLAGHLETALIVAVGELSRERARRRARFARACRNDHRRVCCPGPARRSPRSSLHRRPVSVDNRGGTASI